MVSGTCERLRSLPEQRSSSGVDQMTGVLASSTPQTCADSRGGRATSEPRRPEDFAAMSFRSVACLNL